MELEMERKKSGLEWNKSIDKLIKRRGQILYWLRDTITDYIHLWDDSIRIYIFLLFILDIVVIADYMMYYMTSSQGLLYKNPDKNRYWSVSMVNDITVSSFPPQSDRFWWTLTISTLGWRDRSCSFQRFQSSLVTVWVVSSILVSLYWSPEYRHLT